MSYRLLPLTAFVMLLAAVPLRADDAEDQAVETIEKLGGKVVRNENDPAKPVIEINLYHTKVADADLKALAPLKGLHKLKLKLCAGVTEAGLKELAALKQLRDLNLDYTKVTDVGLKELAVLKGLQTLGLSSMRVTDAGLKELAALNGLQDLFLIGETKVTNAGVTNLRKALPNCHIYDH